MVPNMINDSLHKSEQGWLKHGYLARRSYGIRGMPYTELMIFSKKVCLKIALNRQKTQMDYIAPSIDETFFNNCFRRLIYKHNEIQSLVMWDKAYIAKRKRRVQAQNQKGIKGVRRLHKDKLQLAPYTSILELAERMRAMVASRSFYKHNTPAFSKRLNISRRNTRIFTTLKDIRARMMLQAPENKLSDNLAYQYPLPEIYSENTNVLPTTESSLKMHPHVSLDYLCRRKLDDVLFATSQEMHVRAVHGVLCTRAAKRRQIEQTHLIKGEDKVKALNAYFRDNSFKPYEMTDNAFARTSVVYDNKLEAFGAYVDVSTVPDDFGYIKVVVGGIEEHEAFDKLNDWLLEHSDKPRFFKVVECTLGAQGNIEQELSIQEKNKILSGLDIFYPFIEGGIDKLFDSYMSSRASTLILLGPPGTGKSTLMRTLLSRYAKTAYVTYDARVATMPSFLKTFYNDSDANISVLEDMDLVLGESANQNEFMSTLLNRGDGIVQHRNKKMVISTNLATANKIAEPLKRRGRCYDLITFRELTQMEAIAVDNEVNDSKGDFSSRQSWTLSEVLNPGQFNLDKDRKRIPMAFTAWLT